MNEIIVNGARTHNLKNISIKIPRNKIIVFTGVSGSGKSSLAIDTIFAEGQRRYAESLNSYVRQFLMRLEKPDVDSIKNLSPAIAIDQKVSSNSSSRSTVGTLTEIYEYIKLLFTRIGETYSPISNIKVEKFDSKNIQKYILSLEKNSKIYISFSFIIDKKENIKSILEGFLQKGFTRIYFNNNAHLIEDVIDSKELANIKIIYIIIDRFIIKQEFESDDLSRMIDSIETALFEGKKEMSVIINDNEIKTFTDKFEADGIVFLEPTLDLFSFNNSFGACPSCSGNGFAYGISLNLLIPNKNLSIYDNAIAIWATPSMSFYKQELIDNYQKDDIPIFKPFKDLSKQQLHKVLNGTSNFLGLFPFISNLEKQSLQKIHYRFLLSRYKEINTCILCNGSRLRKEALYIKVNNKTILDICETPIDKIYKWFCELELSNTNQQIAERILLEIKNRLLILINVGLGYLNLNRAANTLSGGESQRIKLTLSLGSNLTDSIYILDEPSIGLHSRDTEKLINVLKNLKDLGNTVLVVEHDESIMKAADEIIDIGPLASYEGGNVVAQGNIESIKKATNSITAKYLNKKLIISRNKKSINLKNKITITGAKHNNLKNINVTIPLECMCVVSGVSGSGKTSLIRHVLKPAVDDFLNEKNNENKLNYDTINFNKKLISNIEVIDQNAMGRSSRSNPVLYIGAFEYIREVFAKMPLSKTRGYSASMFSFNVKGGRCEECEGEGKKTISMQFLADIKLLCDNCNGKRYNSSLLEVLYKNKSIHDVLEMSVDEAADLFKLEKKIIYFLKALQDVGLGYIKLGQSSSTLSGGESQRIKLATYLIQKNDNLKQLFIFDEPTTGLHFHDIQKLLTAFDELLKKGHSIILIEHNLDVIKNADWVIELGPEAGDLGGEIIFEGLPKDLKMCKKSFTAQYL